MTFEYLQRVVIEAQLEVDNIGQCVILGNTDFGEEYYIVIATELGWTEVLEYGPITPDLSLLPLNYNISYSRFEYNEYKIERIIDKFLNNPKRGITQARVVELADIRQYMINPIDKVFPITGDKADE